MAAQGNALGQQSPRTRKPQRGDPAEYRNRWRQRGPPRWGSNQSFLLSPGRCPGLTWDRPFGADSTVDRFQFVEKTQPKDVGHDKVGNPSDW